MSDKELKKLADDLEKKMRKAAVDLDFESAAELRDQMLDVRKRLK